MWQGGSRVRDEIPFLNLQRFDLIFVSRDEIAVCNFSRGGRRFIIDIELIVGNSH